MKKMLSVLAAFLALPTCAHAAAFRVVSLPALPSMPLSAPSALPARPVSLPSLQTPRIAPTLPALPLPVIGRPGISLPSPANPLPLMPKAQVQAPRLAVVASVRLAAAAAPAPAAKAGNEQRAEKLERLFDGDDEQARRETGDEGHLTLPETDLLTEIGIQ